MLTIRIAVDFERCRARFLPAKWKTLAGAKRWFSSRVVVAAARAFVIISRGDIGGFNTNRWFVYIDAIEHEHMLRSKAGVGRRFQTPEAAERAALKFLNIRGTPFRIGSPAQGT